MRALRAMIIANLKMSLRNRAALFWNLIFPAIFIIIFGLVFGGTAGLTFAIGIVGPPTAYQERVMLAMAGNDAFTVSHGTEGEELMALRDGTRDVVLIFDAGQAAAADSIPNVTLFYDQTNRPTAQVAVGTVRQVLAAVAGNAPPAGNILERTIGNLRDFVTGQGDAVVTNVIERPVTTREMSFIDFFVPGILAMSLMNSGVIGLSTAFVVYRERGILRRIRVTPFPLTSFILARVISQLLVAGLQAVILIGMAWAFFGLHLRGNPLVLLLAIAAGALAFLAIGFAISGIAPNAETAASYANLVTFPMLFLSGIFFSMENAPAWLRPITKVLPLSYLVDALREPMSFGNGLNAIWLDLLALLLTFVIAMAIAVRFFRWDSRPA